MIDKDDWRLTNQEKYLNGIKLKLQKYSRYSKKWDHDHCEFRLGKFMISNDPDVNAEGYTTEDHYRWICKKCYDDFKDMFEWQVVL